MQELLPYAAIVFPLLFIVFVIAADKMEENNSIIHVLWVTTVMTILVVTFVWGIRSVFGFVQ